MIQNQNRDFLFFKIFFIFFLCLTKIKAKIKKDKTLNSKGKEKTTEEIKKKKALINEAKETTLKIKNTTAQINTAPRKRIRKTENWILNPTIPPKLVETPLPPLNFKKGVQLCPQITALIVKM